MDSYPPNVFVCSHLIAKDQVGMIYFDEDGNEWNGRQQVHFPYTLYGCWCRCVDMGAKIVIFWRCLRSASTPPSHFRPTLTSTRCAQVFRARAVLERWWIRIRWRGADRRIRNRTLSCKHPSVVLLICPPRRDAKQRLVYSTVHLLLLDHIQYWSGWELCMTSLVVWIWILCLIVLTCYFDFMLVCSEVIHIAQQTGRHIFNRCRREWMWFRPLSWKLVLDMTCRQL